MPSVSHGKHRRAGWKERMGVLWRRQSGGKAGATVPQARRARPARVLGVVGGCTAASGVAQTQGSSSTGLHHVGELGYTGGPMFTITKCRALLATFCATICAPALAAQEHQEQKLPAQ